MQLGHAWDDMTPDSKLAVMRELVSMERKLLSLAFSQSVSITESFTTRK